MAYTMEHLLSVLHLSLPKIVSGRRYDVIRTELARRRWPALSAPSRQFLVLAL